MKKIMETIGTFGMASMCLAIGTCFFSWGVTILRNMSLIESEHR